VLHGVSKRVSVAQFLYLYSRVNKNSYSEHIAVNCIINQHDALFVSTLLPYHAYTCLGLIFSPHHQETECKIWRMLLVFLLNRQAIQKYHSPHFTLGLLMKGLKMSPKRLEAW
jgi:hypothetical protein